MSIKFALTMRLLTWLFVLLSAAGTGLVVLGTLWLVYRVGSALFHRRSRVETVIDMYVRGQGAEEDETTPLNTPPSLPVLWYAVFALLGGLWGSAAGPVEAIIGGVLGVLLVLPVQYIARRNWKRRRALEIQQLLADLHMLAAHMTLGQAIDAASKGSGDVRARLRHYVAHRTATTPPVWPLRRLAEETQDPTLLRVLSRVDAAYKGETELAPLLQTVLDEVTATMRESAQERIETAAVNLTLPVTFLMFAPVLVLTLAPIVAYVLRSL